MPKYRTLSLSDAQRAELVETLTCSKKAYLRERAAAILKIADGTPAAQVAQGGLLQVRDPDTLYSWLHRYRRLRIRYERRDDIRQAFLSLGCALICWNTVQRTEFC